MKTKQFFWSCLLWMGALVMGMTSCSDDEDEPKGPAFKEVKGTIGVSREDKDGMKLFTLKTMLTDADGNQKSLGTEFAPSVEWTVRADKLPAVFTLEFTATPISGFVFEKDYYNLTVNIPVALLVYDDMGYIHQSYEVPDHIAVSWQKGEDLEQVLKTKFPAKLEIRVEATGDSTSPYKITSAFK